MAFLNFVTLLIALLLGAYIGSGPKQPDGRPCLRGPATLEQSEPAGEIGPCKPIVP